ncbi:anthranilate synthase component I [Shewanella sp. OPT22]|nr:anthranilate synthase component I [Shewanella sp. OPT22]
MGQISAVSTSKTSIRYFDDPLSLYRKLTQNSQHTMLLESAEVESKDHLQSILITHSALQIQCAGNQLTFTALTNNGKALFNTIELYFSCEQVDTSENTVVVTLSKPAELLDEDEKLMTTSTLDGLRALVSTLKDTENNQPIFLGGVMAFDLIETVEPLPKVKEGENDCPDYLFYVAETLINIDHTSNTATLTSYQFDSEIETQSLLTKQSTDIIELSEITEFKKQPFSPVDAEVSVNISDDDYKAKVVELKEHIIAGDIFQVVPSRCFSLPCPNTIGAYRKLKETNPSPYMFYFNGPDFTLFGASPESALKYDATTNQVEIYPIAGTRKRGKKANGEIDQDLDGRIELELRLDKKELSEHLMLVDLARNDVARISKSGTRKVAELLKVDRYSHVMHLVSRVTGQLREPLDALHAYQACMNMGTLTGAPKVRAAQLLREAEGERRGSYGGAVGYINSKGDMDTCIVIRSAYVKNGIAHIQAGAGVVFDSDPQAEADETRHKSQAVISAIKLGGGQ